MSVRHILVAHAGSDQASQDGITFIKHVFIAYAWSDQESLTTVARQDFRTSISRATQHVHCSALGPECERAPDLQSALT